MAEKFSNANFAEVLSSNEIVVVDFWAEWCGPCKMVGPIIDELAQDYAGKAVIGKVDVDEEGDLATKYGIRNIPTVLYFKNGELVDKNIGAGTKSMFEDKLKAIL